MKKISTLKNAESLSKLPRKESVDHQDSENSASFEPEAQSIANILNYSKALSVRKSSLLRHILTINN
jgi:hypothetical protein